MQFFTIVVGAFILVSCGQKPEIARSTQPLATSEEPGEQQTVQESVTTPASTEPDLAETIPADLEESETVDSEDIPPTLDEAQLAELAELKAQQQSLEESIAIRESMMLEASQQQEQIEALAAQQANGAALNVDFGDLLGTLIDVLLDLDVDAVLDLIAAVIDGDIDAIIDAIIDIVAGIVAQVAGLTAELDAVNAQIEAIEGSQ